MGHNIHGEMVYSFEQPMWHALTKPSLVPMTAIEILNERFGGGFPIFQRPITVLLNGEQTETEHRAIVRGVSPYDKQEVVLGYSTDKYHPLQPNQVCHMYDISVNEPAETMAFLGNGEEMFITWKMPEFEIGVGDLHRLYGVIRVGFNTLKATRLFTSIHRCVCQNTVTLAENWAKQHTDGKGKGEIWKGKGTSQTLLQDLGYWMSHVQLSSIREGQLIQSLFGQLAQVPVHSETEARQILVEAYPNKDDVSAYYPPELRGRKQETVEDYNKSQASLRDGILELFNGEGTAITPTYKGMVDATSEYVCHVMPSKKPIAESVMFGGRQKITSDMITTLTNRMG